MYSFTQYRNNNPARNPCTVPVSRMNAPKLFKINLICTLVLILNKLAKCFRINKSPNAFRINELAKSFRINTFTYEEVRRRISKKTPVPERITVRGKQLKGKPTNDPIISRRDEMVGLNTYKIVLSFVLLTIVTYLDGFPALVNRFKQLILNLKLFIVKRNVYKSDVI